MKLDNIMEKLEKYQILLLGLLITISIMFSAVVISKSLSRNVITVTGSYSQNVTSDNGSLRFEISIKNPDKANAYKTINEQLPVIQKYLEEQGIKKDEIEIKSLSSYPSYKTNSNGMSTNDVAYYNVSQWVEIKSNDVQKIKFIANDINNLINKGIDINAEEPCYFYSKLSDIKKKLLQEATKDAKQRADAMLKATHNHTGKIKSVRMGVFQITPVNSTNVSDYGINDTTTIEKKITSVANVTFTIK